MPSYENQKCPVCNQVFGDGDDIVTCPHCGTPHHRECYNKIGQCANKDKHISGFDYQKDVAAHIKSDEKNPTDSKYFTPEKQTSSDEGNKDTQQEKFPFGSFIPLPQQDFPLSEEEIDGVAAADVCCVVRTKAHRFIEKFKSGKKIGWNWAAFIFGPYYLFFRKMYKEGALTLAIQLIINLVVQSLYYKEFTAFTKFIESNADALKNPTNQFIEEAMKYYDKVLPMLMIIFVANVVLHFIIALFADNWYKKRVVGIVKKVYQKLDNGGEFSQTSLLVSDEPKMTQTDMKRLYLSRLGGTSLLSPITAVFILDIVTELISRITF